MRPRHVCQPAERSGGRRRSRLVRKCWAEAAACHRVPALRDVRPVAQNVAAGTRAKVCDYRVVGARVFGSQRGEVRRTCKRRRPGAGVASATSGRHGSRTVRALSAMAGLCFDGRPAQRGANLREQYRGGATGMRAPGVMPFVVCTNGAAMRGAGQAGTVLADWALELPWLQAPPVCAMVTGYLRAALCRRLPSLDCLEAKRASSHHAPAGRVWLALQCGVAAVVAEKVLWLSGADWLGMCTLWAGTMLLMSGYCMRIQSSGGCNSVEWRRLQLQHKTRLAVRSTRQLREEVVRAGLAHSMVLSMSRSQLIEWLLAPVVAAGDRVGRYPAIHSEGCVPDIFRLRLGGWAYYGGVAELTMATLADPQSWLWMGRKLRWLGLVLSIRCIGPLAGTSLRWTAAGVMIAIGVLVAVCPHALVSGSFAGELMLVAFMVTPESSRLRSGALRGGVTGWAQRILRFVPAGAEEHDYPGLPGSPSASYSPNATMRSPVSQDGTSTHAAGEVGKQGSPFAGNRDGVDSDEEAFDAWAAEKSPSDLADARAAPVGRVSVLVGSGVRPAPCRAPATPATILAEGAEKAVPAGVDPVRARRGTRRPRPTHGENGAQREVEQAGLAPKRLEWAAISVQAFANRQEQEWVDDWLAWMGADDVVCEEHAPAAVAAAAEGGVPPSPGAAMPECVICGACKRTLWVEWPSAPDDPPLALRLALFEHVTRSPTCRRWSVDFPEVGDATGDETVEEQYADGMEGVVRRDIDGKDIRVACCGSACLPSGIAPPSEQAFDLWEDQSYSGFVTDFMKSVGITDPGLWTQPATGGEPEVARLPEDVERRLATCRERAGELLRGVPAEQEVPPDYCEPPQQVQGNGEIPFDMECVPLSNYLSEEALAAVNAIVDTWGVVVPVMAVGRGDDSQGSSTIGELPGASASAVAGTIPASSNSAAGGGAAEQSHAGGGASGSDADEPLPASDPPATRSRQQSISEFGAGVIPAMDDVGEAGVTLNGVWMPRPDSQLGQQGHMILPKPLGNVRVAQLNVRGCFGQRDFCGAPRVMGVILAKYCVRFNIDVLCVQDLNLSTGREHAVQLGLRSQGFLGTFFFETAPGVGNHSNNVGFIFHRRHYQNIQEDEPELVCKVAVGAGRTERVRAACIRIRLHDGRVWGFVSLYGIPKPLATAWGRAATATILAYIDELRDSFAEQERPLIVCMDANSVIDPRLDVKHGTRTASPLAPAKYLSEHGFEDAFRAAGHDLRAWTFVCLTGDDMTAHRIDYIMVNEYARPHVARASHESMSTPGAFDHAAVIVDFGGLAGQPKPFIDSEAEALPKVDALSWVESVKADEHGNRVRGASTAELLHAFLQGESVQGRKQQAKWRLHQVRLRQLRLQTEQLPPRERDALQVSVLNEITALLRAGLAASVGEAVPGAARTPPYVHLTNIVASALAKCGSAVVRFEAAAADYGSANPSWSWARPTPASMLQLSELGASLEASWLTAREAVEQLVAGYKSFVASSYTQLLSTKQKLMFDRAMGLAEEAQHIVAIAVQAGRESDYASPAVFAHAAEAHSAAAMAELIGPGWRAAQTSAWENGGTGAFAGVSTEDERPARSGNAQPPVIPRPCYEEDGFDLPFTADTRKQFLMRHLPALQSVMLRAARRGHVSADAVATFWRDPGTQAQVQLMLVAQMPQTALVPMVVGAQVLYSVPTGALVAAEVTAQSQDSVGTVFKVTTATGDEAWARRHELAYAPPPELMDVVAEDGANCDEAGIEEPIVLPNGGGGAAPGESDEARPRRAAFREAAVQIAVPETQKASEAALRATETALRATAWEVRWAEEQESLGNIVEVRDAGPKGRGLFACGTGVPAGTKLQYYGEVLTYAQRRSRYPNVREPGSYVMEVAGEAQDQSALYIDADKTKCFARYVNHAPKATANAAVKWNDLFPVLTISEFLPPGTEILFDYGTGFFETSGGASLVGWRGFRHDGTAAVRRGARAAPGKAADAHRADGGECGSGVPVSKDAQLTALPREAEPVLSGASVEVSGKRASKLTLRTPREPSAAGGTSAAGARSLQMDEGNTPSDSRDEAEVDAAANAGRHQPDSGSAERRVQEARDAVTAAAVAKQTALRCVAQAQLAARIGFEPMFHGVVQQGSTEVPRTQAAMEAMVEQVIRTWPAATAPQPEQTQEPQVHHVHRRWVVEERQPDVVCGATDQANVPCDDFLRIVARNRDESQAGWISDTVVNFYCGLLQHWQTARRLSYSQGSLQDRSIGAASVARTAVFGSAFLWGLRRNVHSEADPPRPALWVTNTEWVKRHVVGSTRNGVPPRLDLQRLDSYDRFYFVVHYGGNHWVYVRANLRTGGMFWVDNQFGPETSVDTLDRDIAEPLRQFIAALWTWADPVGGGAHRPKRPQMRRIRVWAADANSNCGVPQMPDGHCCGVFMQAALRVDMAQPPGCTDNGETVFARIRDLPTVQAVQQLRVHQAVEIVTGKLVQSATDGLRLVVPAPPQVLEDLRTARASLAMARRTEALAATQLRLVTTLPSAVVEEPAQPGPALSVGDRVFYKQRDGEAVFYKRARVVAIEQDVLSRADERLRGYTIRFDSGGERSTVLGRLEAVAEVLTPPVGGGANRAEGGELAADRVGDADAVGAATRVPRAAVEGPVAPAGAAQIAAQEDQDVACQAAQARFEQSFGVYAGRLVSVVRMTCRGGTLKRLVVKIVAAIQKLQWALFEEQRQRTFLKKGVNSVKRRSPLFPRTGQGEGSAEQRESAAKYIPKQFDPRGTPHPITRLTRDRCGEDWPKWRSRAHVCAFSELSPEAQAWAAEDPDHTGFGLPAVGDMGGRQAVLPQEYGGVRDHRVHFPNYQRTVTNEQFVEPGWLEYKLWRAYQPAAWLPQADDADNIWRHVLDPVDYDSDEWREIIGKNFETSAGPDGLQIGILRFCPEAVQRMVLDMLNDYLASGQMPSVAKLGRIWFIKKGDSRFKFRPITVLGHFFKAVEKVVSGRMADVVERNMDRNQLSGAGCTQSGVIVSSQFAFQKGKSAVDCAGVVKAVLEDMHGRRLRAAKTRRQHGTTDRVECGEACFLDLSSYYDAINPDMIEMSLRAHCMPEKLIKYVLEGGYEAHSQVLTMAGPTDATLVAGGTRQGNALSIWISLFCLNPLLRELSLQPYTMTNGTTVGACGFADDTCLLSASRADMERQMAIVGAWTRFSRIAINADKCDYVSFALDSIGDEPAPEVAEDESADDGCDRAIPPPLVFDGFDQEAVNEAGELEAQNDARRDWDDIDSLVAADFYVPGRGAVKRMSIKGTPLEGPEAPIRHLGVWYTPLLDYTCVGEKVQSNISWLLAEIRKRQFTFQQTRAAIRSLVVPSAIYAALEASLPQRVAHVMGTAVKTTMQAAMREARSSAYDYMFVPVKQGGLGCVTIQQERLSAMSQDLVTSLNQPGLKGRVYRDRLKSAICGGPEGQKSFVADAISELAEYGHFVRFRGNELVARTLGELVPPNPVWRSATRAWSSAAWNGTGFHGRSFADVSPLGAFLHRHALENQGHLSVARLERSDELKDILSRRPYKAAIGSVTAVVAAVLRARANIRNDYMLEKRMSVSPLMPHNLPPGQERCQWAAVGRLNRQPLVGDAVALEEAPVRWDGDLTMAYDQWADLADAVPEAAQLVGVWGASDGGRRPCDDGTREFAFGCGGVFAPDPRLSDTRNCDPVSANCDCRQGSPSWETCGKRNALHAEMVASHSFECSVPERVGASATSVNTTEFIGVKNVVGLLKRGHEQMFVVDNQSVLDQYVLDTHGLPPMRRLLRGADHVWRIRIERIRVQHRLHAVRCTDACATCELCAAAQPTFGFPNEDTARWCSVCGPAVRERSCDAATGAGLAPVEHYEWDNCCEHVFQSRPPRLEGRDWNERGGWGYRRHCRFPPAHKVASHQDDKYEKARATARRAVTTRLLEENRMGALVTASSKWDPIQMARQVGDVLGSLIHHADVSAVAQGMADSAGFTAGQSVRTMLPTKPSAHLEEGELQAGDGRAGRLLSPSTDTVRVRTKPGIRVDLMDEVRRGERLAEVAGSVVVGGVPRPAGRRDGPTEAVLFKKGSRPPSAASPNLAVEWLNCEADVKATAAVDAAMSKPPSWLQFPFGGTPFVLVHNNGLVTGDARSFVRARIADQALAYCQSSNLRDQGAVYRNAAGVDMRAVERRLRDPEARPFEYRLLNGTASAQNTMRHRYLTLRRQMQDGYACCLPACMTKQHGNLRHLLFCLGCDEARRAFMAKVEKVFQDAADAQCIDMETFNAHGERTIEGRRVYGAMPEYPFLRRLGILGPLQFADNGDWVGEHTGDPVDMANETADDLSYRGVFPAWLRVRLEAKWERTDADMRKPVPPTVKIAVSDFLHKLGRVVVDGMRDYWVDHYRPALDAAVEDLGVQAGWRKSRATLARQELQQRTGVTADRDGDVVDSRGLVLDAEQRWHCVNGGDCMEAQAGQGRVVFERYSECCECQRVTDVMLLRGELRKLICAERQYHRDTELTAQWRRRMPDLRQVQQQLEPQLSHTLVRNQSRKASAIFVEPYLRSARLAYVVNAGGQMARGKKRLQRQHGKSGYDLLPTVAFHCETQPLNALRCGCEAPAGGRGPHGSGRLQQCPICAKLVTVAQRDVPAGLQCQRCNKEVAVVQCVLCARLVCAATNVDRDGDGSDSDAEDEHQRADAASGAPVDAAGGGAAADPDERVVRALPSKSQLRRLRRDQLASLYRERIGVPYGRLRPVMLQELLALKAADDVAAAAAAAAAGDGPAVAQRHRQSACLSRYTFADVSAVSAARAATLRDGRVCVDCVEPYRTASDRARFGHGTRDAVVGVSDIPEEERQSIMSRDAYMDAEVEAVKLLYVQGQEAEAKAKALSMYKEMKEEARRGLAAAAVVARARRVYLLVRTGGPWAAADAARRAARSYADDVTSEAYAPGDLRTFFQSEVPTRQVPAPQFYEGGDAIRVRAEPILDEADKWRFRLGLARARRQAALAGQAVIERMSAPDTWLEEQLEAAADTVGGQTHLAGLPAWAVAATGVLGVDGVEQLALWFRFGAAQGIVTVGSDGGCVSKMGVERARHVSIRPLVAPWPADRAVGPAPNSTSTLFGLLTTADESRAGRVYNQQGVRVEAGDADSKGAAALVVRHTRGTRVAKASRPSAMWNGDMAAYPLTASLADAAAELDPGDVIVVLWWDGHENSTPATLPDEPTGRRLRCSYGVFLDFSDKGRRINYHFVTAAMQGANGFECQLDDAITNRTARIRRACSRGAVLMTLAGSLIGLHDAQPGVHSVRRAGRTATTDERFEAHHMDLGSVESLQECWPSPVRESGVSVFAILADLGRHIAKE